MTTLLPNARPGGGIVSYLQWRSAGFLQSALKFLNRVGLSGRSLKQATKSIVNEAEIASAWILQQQCAKVRNNLAKSLKTLIVQTHIGNPPQCVQFRQGLRPLMGTSEYMYL